MQPIPKPSNSWLDQPVKPKVARRPLSGDEIKARLIARGKIEGDLRSEQQWREHHENKQPKHWHSKAEDMRLRQAQLRRLAVFGTG